MHYRAVAGWIRSQKDTSTLDPFFKTWIAMIETQLALNTGASLLPEIESWLDAGQSHAIDPFFVSGVHALRTFTESRSSQPQGCSVLLPGLMVRQRVRQGPSPNQIQSNLPLKRADAPPSSPFQLKASRLSRTTALAVGPTTDSSAASLHHRASLLQDEIASTAASPTSPLRLSVLSPNNYTTTSCPSSPSPSQPPTTAPAIAAEIFRHALHIYVFRASHSASTPLDARARRSVDEALGPLALVHDDAAGGPLSNLGWALVVVGVEVAADAGARAFLRSKWAALHLLGLENSLASEGIVLEWWRRWDDAGGMKGVGWLELMRLMGGEELVPLV